MSTKSLVRPVPFNIPDAHRDEAVEALQGYLPYLVAFALRLKQGHWNLRGDRFKTIHEQFDEILEDVRTASDDTAERIVTLGGAADGLPATVADTADFAEFPKGLMSVEQAIDAITEDLAVTIQHGRQAIEKLGEADPVSEDLCIGIVAALEKHHWMLGAQRGN